MRRKEGAFQPERIAWLYARARRSFRAGKERIPDI